MSKNNIEEEDVHVNKIRNERVNKNIKAAVDFGNATRKLVKEQNIEIGNLRNLIQQQAQELTNLKIQFNQIRAKIFGTGPTA